MQIRIKGYTFTLSEPFRDGTVLTKAEAQALNDLRAENIQNNLRKLVAEATAELAQGELLSEARIVDIQGKLTKYDLAYTFVEKHIPRPRRGDIEAAARELAEERVGASLRQQEITVSPDELEFMIAEVEGLPAIIDEARALVSARRRAVQGSLEDL